MTDEVPVDPVKEEIEAWERIALTLDGKVVHRYLRRVLEAVILTPDSGALHDHNGRRTLARDIMRLMASGIEANRDRPRDPEPPILTGARNAVAVAGSRTERRRAWLAAQPEPGSDPAA